MVQIQWKRTERGLMLTADDDARAELRELAEDNADFDSDSTTYDVLDSMLGNSEFDWVDATETGDLTDALMIGIRDENEQVIERYAWMRGSVESLQRHLLDNGSALLIGGC